MCSLLALLVSPLFLVEAKEERLMAIFADELHIAAHDLRHGELPELM
jgi:hypothetical protein